MDFLIASMIKSNHLSKNISVFLPKQKKKGHRQFKTNMGCHPIKKNQIVSFLIKYPK